MLNMAEFKKRRHVLMQKTGPKSIIILPSASSVKRNGDYDYPFRQESDFYYLTGFEEPEAVAVLLPNATDGEFILFNRPKNREKEIWEGLRAGQTGACETFGADQSFDINRLEEKLPELLLGREVIHYAIGANPTFDKVLFDSIEKIRSKIRNGLQSHFIFSDLTESVHEMRLIKSPFEIDLMRKAADITAKAHIRAMKTCRPGKNEYELEAELTHEFQRNGARYTAYSSIVGSGSNTCILHYTQNNRVIESGDLVLIDAGCEYENYAADVTRTFPANGRFSAEQRVIYELVLQAQQAGINTAKPGIAFAEIQNVIVNILTQGLIDLGLLKGNRKQLIESQAYFAFYMHKSGHWLGLDVHDVGCYTTQGKWRTLQPGMVLTVEPGIYISADLADIPAKWHSIGIRIEDDILITEHGNEVLSQHAPKTIADIEAIMSS